MAPRQRPPSRRRHRLAHRLSATAAPSPSPVAPTPTATATQALQYPACKSLPPLPAPFTVEVQPPAAAVPATLAGLSGSWEFTDSVGLGHLIVQRVSPTEATAVYQVPTQVAIMPIRLQADGRLVYTSVITPGVVFTWSLSADGKTLQAVRTQPGWPTETLAATRCTALAAATPTVAPGQQFPRCILLPPIPPEETKVQEPAAAVPATLRAYSGAWEGYWGDAASGFYPSSFIVTAVGGTGVKATYIFSGILQGSFDFAAQPDGSLKYSASGVTFTWSLSADGKTLSGTRTQSGQAVRVTMTRCIPP